MAKIITENFRVETSNELFNSFKNTNATIENNFYASIGTYNTVNSLGLTTEDKVGIQSIVTTQLKTLAADSNYYIVGSSVDKANNILNTQAEKRDFQRRIIFGNKVNDTDVRYMFYKNVWQSNTVYDDFDDMQDITQVNSIVTVADDEQGFLVFKCLENNNGGLSSVTPSLTGIDPNSYEFIATADNYIWKYMFKVSSSDANIYKTTDSLPLPSTYGDVDVIAAAKETISQIIIEETPSNQWAQYLFGAATASTNASDVIVFASTQSTSMKFVQVDITPKTTFTQYSTEDAYKNMYLKSGDKLYDILGTKYLSTNRVELRMETTDAIEDQSTCQLVPKLRVSSSTLTGERCKAYGIINQFGTLIRIGFETKGSEYKFATAELVYPPSLTQAVTTKLRCVVSPSGGHGSNPIAELASSRLAIITNFSGESLQIPDSNTYTKVGLIKNPKFTDGNFAAQFDNRTSITVSDDQSAVALPNYFVQQYIKTVNATSLQVGVTYVITDLGTTTQEQWNGMAGTSLVTYAIGTTFVAHSSYTVNAALGTGTTSTSRGAPDQDVDLNTGDEVITAKIHQSVVSGGNTTIHLVDYYGAFENKFHKGPISVKADLVTPVSAELSINNASTDVVYGKYTPYTGELLHYIDFDPITRQLERKEKIKFIFDF